MKGDGLRCREIGPHAVRDEVQAVLSRQVQGERVIRAIHSAERHEISRNQQPGPHASCSR
jgi:hypothetical protein